MHDPFPATAAASDSYGNSNRNSNDASENASKNNLVETSPTNTINNGKDDGNTAATTATTATSSSSHSDSSGGGGGNPARTRDNTKTNLKPNTGGGTGSGEAGAAGGSPENAMMDTDGDPTTTATAATMNGDAKLTVKDDHDDDGDGDSEDDDAGGEDGGGSDRGNDNDHDDPDDGEEEKDADVVMGDAVPAPAPAPDDDAKGDSSVAAEANENAKEDEKKVDGDDASASGATAASASAAPVKKKTGVPPLEPPPTTASSVAAVSTTAVVAAPAGSPPPPVLRGTLSYDLEERRHLIRGMWSYENSTASMPQRFELLRNLDPAEDPRVLPLDGEFHGSFSLTYFHTTSKGKQKERSKVIPESGVKITFTKLVAANASNNNDNGTAAGAPGDATSVYQVDGTGMNQFGIFYINGTAEPSPVDESQYVIELRKRYDTTSQAAPAAADDGNGNGNGDTYTMSDGGGNKKFKKSKPTMGGAAAAAPLVSSMGKFDGAPAAWGGDPAGGELPPPARSFDTGVVCLRGRLYKEESEELGVGTELVVHRISGMWSSGLDLILADPQNVRGLCNRFEYEHKSSSPNGPFPVSGRYSGWFDLSHEDGSKTKVQEKDVTLKFRRNNAGHHNVEGKGSNAFGKYSISGTLTLDNVITIFRQFAPRKIKVARPVTSAPPPINAPGQARRPSVAALPAKQLSLDDVRAPDPGTDGPIQPLQAPDHAAYSAVSRGVLRVNEDGSHSCTGKWAMTREHFSNQQISNFGFRLESHFAQEAMRDDPEAIAFPLDSDMYKGSFQLKKGGNNRYQTIIDNQVVMKFRENSAGSFNVYGRGVNSIGVFNLTGTMIISGKTGGQVELYRMYPPELLAGPSTAPAAGSKTAATSLSPTSSARTAEPLPGPPALPPSSPSDVGPGGSSLFPGPARAGLGGRRESSRLVKVPSRLEDDDPDAQLARIMDKSADILRFMKEKDKELGGFFRSPVDPVALGIPTYLQVIKEPMDLKTLQDRMDREDVDTPEEFVRLTRLIFENAMTFNVDPTHAVHRAARSLLITFNQKYRDIERMLANIRRTGGGVDDRKKGKNDKKRKRGMEELKSPKQRRLEEAQEMAAANAQSMATLASLAPAISSNDVTRSEFNLMMSMVQTMQQQLVQTYTLLAELSSDDIEMGTGGMSGSDGYDMGSSFHDTSPPEKKKPKKKPDPPKPVERPVVEEDDNSPLTLQEQELLTETINELPGDHLHGVIQIIREAAKLTGDEDEIDLEIDQLDTSTQRKLLRYVSKFAKPKKQKAKAPKKAKAPGQSGKGAPAAKKAASKLAPSPSPLPTPTSTKPKADSFFSFGNHEDSDSESDGEVDEAEAPPAASAPSPNPSSQRQGQPVASKDFRLGGLGDDDDDDEDDDDLGGGGMATNWNISKLESESRKKVGDDDDAWGAAREEAMAAKAREEDKKKREEKMKADAEQQKRDRLAQAVAHGEEIKAQRQAEEEEEARLQEEKEREAEEERKRAREEAKKQVKAVVQTVDFDAERDLMKQLEQNYADTDMGGASPSSDFGF